MPLIHSLNIGGLMPSRHTSTGLTAIDKRPVSGATELRPPGDRAAGAGSGVAGDHIGDIERHGGDDQAIYAFQREDLDEWASVLGRDLTNGFFGENLTTKGLDVNAALIGEIWRVGPDVELRVTSPRIPCNTFQDHIGQSGWLKTFTRAGRPGAYLAVVKGGFVSSGDSITVIHRPDHDVTVSFAFEAATTQRELLPRLLEAGDDLSENLRVRVEMHRVNHER